MTDRVADYPAETFFATYNELLYCNVRHDILPEVGAQQRVEGV